jgi:hypothetical protein
MSRPGDARGKRRRKRIRKLVERDREKERGGGSEKRAEWSCSAVAGVMHRRLSE